MRQGPLECVQRPRVEGVNSTLPYKKVFTKDLGGGFVHLIFPPIGTVSKCVQVSIVVVCDAQIEKE